MKRKVLKGLFVLLIVLISVFNVNVNMYNDNLFAMSLANIEALAQNESGNNPCKTRTTTVYGPRLYCTEAGAPYYAWISKDHSCSYRGDSGSCKEGMEHQNFDCKGQVSSDVCYSTNYCRK